jgi:hypothetical protein
MRAEVALIKEQGVNFAVIAVAAAANTPATREETLEEASGWFPGIPVVIMSVSGHRPRYFGRRDLVRFLANVPVEALPWRKVNIA